MKIYEFQKNALEIVRIEISLSSKNRDVAESRNEKMHELFTEIEHKYRGSIKADVFEEVATIIKNADNEFHTALYKNVATGHIEKAAKLKTENAKHKYWDLAREVVYEGIKNQKSDKSILENLLNQIP